MIRHVIPARHPSLPGHFPGHPVVPGVVLLDEVVAALEEQRGRPVDLTALPVVKFLRPLAPGQPFTIHFSDAGPGRVSFTVETEAGRVASGTMGYSDRGGPPA